MWFDLAMILILLICLVTDLKNRKIYNAVLLPGFLLSLVFHTFVNGWAGLGSSLLGALIGILILFIPFAMGGMGAGDVKLLGLIGAWKGSMFVFYTSIYMALVGGVIALAILLFQKGWLQRFKGFAYFFAFLRQGKIQSEWIQTSARKTTYPYGLAIVAGAFCSLWFSFLEVI
ncbi:A24 family peptidase [Pontibacillus marinus]|uniref:Peptidase A24 n=1 Tax=Pontibacillus marinus BH030004 = DSM 16465 TaxID=1385511 RepID=A0A0A5FWJ0_9BACI|nr:prepilin peptidase [Pontibacillus marinus]KGX83388.1 peptidase A24 [Pontibacillus marinus BH030004 = DSM 16465]